MGRRRAKATKVVKKKQPTMQTEFKCPFCNYEKCVAAKMDYDKETGTLECRVCAATYTATINYLSEPVDVFSEWIDQCEAEDEDRAKRDAARDRGEDVEEDAPAPKRTRIDFADPAEDEAEVDPNDDPAARGVMRSRRRGRRRRASPGPRRPCRIVPQRWPNGQSFGKRS